MRLRLGAHSISALVTVQHLASANQDLLSIVYPFYEPSFVTGNIGVAGYYGGALFDGKVGLTQANLQHVASISLFGNAAVASIRIALVPYAMSTLAPPATSQFIRDYFDFLGLPYAHPDSPRPELASLVLFGGELRASDVLSPATDVQERDLAGPVPSKAASYDALFPPLLPDGKPNPLRPPFNSVIEQVFAHWLAQYTSWRTTLPQTAYAPKTLIEFGGRSRLVQRAGLPSREHVLAACATDGSQAGTWATSVTANRPSVSSGYSPKRNTFVTHGGGLRVPNGGYSRQPIFMIDRDIFAPGTEQLLGSQVDIYRDGQFVATASKENASEWTLQGTPGTGVQGDGSWNNPAQGSLSDTDFPSASDIANNVGFAFHDYVASREGLLTWELTSNGLDVGTFGGQPGLARIEFIDAPSETSTSGDGNSGFDLRQQTGAAIVGQGTRLRVVVMGGFKWLSAPGTPNRTYEALTKTATYSLRLSPLPTQMAGGIQQHTAAEGSYLLVTKLTGDHPTDSVARTGAGAPTAGPLRTFTSVVVDTTPPVAAIEQVDDYYIGNPTSVSQANQDDAFLAVDASEPTLLASLKEDALQPEFPGSYSVSAGQAFTDRAGNAVANNATADFTVHDIPSDGNYGPQAKFTLPTAIAVNTRGRRSLAYDKAIQSVRLAFNTRVRKVTPAQISVTGVDRNGNALSVTPAIFNIDYKNYDVILPAAEQSPSTSWKITFTPTAIEPIADDRQSFVFSSRTAFPAQGEPGAIYYSRNTQKEYEFSKALLAYVEINQAPVNKMRLACRAAWLINQSTSPGREPVDVSRAEKTVLPTPSITETITPPQNANDEKTSVLSSTSDAFLRPDAGVFTEQLGGAFVPCLPSSPDVDSTGRPFSFFGVPTTIFPARPQSLSDCSAPLEEQPSSSLFFGGPPITSLRIKMKAVPIGHSVAMSTLGTLFLANAGFNTLPSSISGFGPPLFPQPFVLSSVFQGSSTTQNVWSFFDSPKNVTSVSSPQLPTPGAIVEAVSTQFSVFARRSVTTYASLETSVVGLLQLVISGRVVTRNAVTYLSSGHPDRTAVAHRVHTFEHVVTLTKSQEASLVAGGVVNAVASNAMVGAFVYNRAAAGSPADFQPIPAYAYAWELQRV